MSQDISITSFQRCSTNEIVHFIALHLIFLHLDLLWLSAVRPLILSTGPSEVFLLLLEPGNNHVLVIFFSKRDRGKVLTSDIVVIHQLPFTELCQHAEGFYRTETHTHCPSTLQSDFIPGSQCRHTHSWHCEKIAECHGHETTGF